jgi:hypothetical protein
VDNGVSEIASIFTAVGIIENALAVVAAVREFAYISGAVTISKRPFTMNNILFKLPLIAPAIGPDEYAAAMHMTIFHFTFINRSVGITKCASAVDNAVLEFPGIAPAILMKQGSRTILAITLKTLGSICHGGKAPQKKQEEIVMFFHSRYISTLKNLIT